MSTLTAENILVLIEQLPTAERTRLDQLLTQQTESPKTKPPLDKRVPCKPMPDDTRERAWIKKHKQDYAGQWVALDGDRLIAASPNRLEISAAIASDNAILPLIVRIPSLEDLPYVGI